MSVVYGDTQLLNIYCGKVELGYLTIKETPKFFSCTILTL